jgi:hypothetical protein
VIVEFDVLGPHLGPLRGLPPTGRAFRCRMAERQLGVADDPLSLRGRLGTAAAHPITIRRGLLRQVVRR